MSDYSILASSGLAIPHAGTYEMGTVHSFIFFIAQHLVVGRVRGRFSSSAATLVVPEDPTETRVDVVIYTASIDTQNDQRDEDLRSPEMLNVNAFPSMIYHGAGVTPRARWRLACRR